MGRIILVTGGAGYIGSHVCKSLVANQFLPITYDNLCSGNEEAVQCGPFENGDIRDRARLAKVMRTYKPIAIIHCAALIQVAESVASPNAYYDNNVNGSLALIEEARSHKIQNLVFSSTAAVYGQPEDVRLTEASPLNPINPYGRTKLAMENLINDCAAAYGMNTAILRYFNAAGADPERETGTAYKKDSHIIPLLMRVASGDMEAIKLFGTDYNTPDGSAIRDYIHVSDIADAHIRALLYIAGNQESVTLNLGTSKGHSVKEVIDAARRVTGQPIAVEECERREGDPAVLVADAAKAKGTLGWKPQYSDIETIIKTAWQWRQKQIAPHYQHKDKEAA